MMGMVTIRMVLYLGVVALGSTLFIYTVIAGGCTWLKAMNSGILQFHKILPKVYYWITYVIVIACLVFSVMNFTGAYTCRKVIADSEVIGTEAFFAYEKQTSQNSGVEPEEYLLIKQAEYENKIDNQRQNGFFYLFLSMAWFSIMILQTGFVTQNGYYAMGSQKPEQLMPVQEQDRICFYSIDHKTSKSEKYIFAVKDTPENIRYYTPLFESYADYARLENPGNPEKQGKYKKQEEKK